MRPKLYKITLSDRYGLVKTITKFGRTEQDAIRQVLQETMFDGVFVSKCVEV
jgi:hypothetical protein